MNAWVCIGWLTLAAAGGEVTVELRLEPPIIPFHEEARFSIVVESPADVSVHFPDRTGRFGRLNVPDTPEYRSEALENDRIRRIETYTLDAIFTGHYDIEPVTVTWQAASGSTTSSGGKIVKPSPSLFVRELTADEEAAAQRFDSALAEPDFAPARPLLRWTGWLLLIAVALCAALVLLNRLKGRSAVPETAVRTPWDVARERLQALEQGKLPQAGQTERYYVLLSKILRGYIEDRFHVRAQEQTTPEFLDEIAASGLLSENHQGWLGGFLRHCDRVKFAQYRPSPEEIEGGFDTVLVFVNETVPTPEALGEEAAA